MFVRPRVAEKKWNAVNLATAFSSVSTAVSTADLCQIAQGSEVNSRDGRFIRSLAIEWDGTLVGGAVNAVTDDAYNVVRIGIVKAAVGTTLSGFSLFSIADPRAYAGVIEWVCDKRIALVVRGADSTGYIPSPEVTKFKVNVPDLLEYSGSASNTISGATYIAYCVSDSAAVANPGYVNGLVTLWFTDN